LRLENVGQIKRAEVSFGDLTVLTGPQASGKSIFLEFLKLVVDSGPIVTTLKRYGVDWEKKTDDFLDVYLGEGMSGVWKEGQSRVVWAGENLSLKRLTDGRRSRRPEEMFFIPAQRVLTLSNGWPRPFTDYSAGDPFTVRDFSEKLRRQMESGLGKGDAVFPQKGRLMAEVRRLLERSVFYRFSLRLDKHGAQKRLVLNTAKGAPSLPYLVWSAGQREFVPLLLGFYWLLPPTRVSRKTGIQWVVIEELEMGLHPRAISTVLLLILVLLWRGYKVCLSTHSPHVLDVVWALRTIQEKNGDPTLLIDLFDSKATERMKNLARAVAAKAAKVYYFDPETGVAKDISKLDPGSEDSMESGWGGLTELSGRVADVVARVTNVAGQ